MGISVTLNMYGMEKHIVLQIQTKPGGIGRLMEHWMEQYHQIGYRFDLAYCHIGKLEGKAAIPSSNEHTSLREQICWDKKEKDRCKGER